MKSYLNLLYSLMLITAFVLAACGGGATPTEAPAEPYKQSCSDFDVWITIESSIKDLGCSEDGVSATFLLGIETQVTVSLTNNLESLNEVVVGNQPANCTPDKDDQKLFACEGGGYFFSVSYDTHPIPTLYFVSMNDEEVTIFFSYNGNDQLFLDHANGGAIAIGKIYGQGVNLEQVFKLGELIYLEPGDEVKLCNHSKRCSETVIVHQTEELIASGANEHSINYPKEIPSDLRAPGFDLTNVIGAQDGTILSQVGPWSLYWAYLPEIGNANLQLVWFYYDIPAYYKFFRTDMVCYNGIKYNSEEQTEGGWHMWTTDCDPDQKQAPQSIVVDCYNQYEITVSSYFEGFGLYGCLSTNSFFVETDRLSLTIVLNPNLDGVLYVTHGAMPGVKCDNGNCSFENYSFRVVAKPLP